ncbi:MAG: transcription antitermination factor NusB [Thermoanaerobaculia bacterium]
MTSEPQVGVDVRVRAALVIDRVLESRAPATGLLERARESTGARDLGLLDELVLGTLRWLRRLDRVLEQASGRSIGEGGDGASRAATIDPDLLAPLRVASYQLLYLDRVPAHAAVNAAVEDVKQRSHRGAVGFANAVLRRIAKRPALDAWPVASEASERLTSLDLLAIETSYPDLVVRRWVERFGAAAARRALTAGNRKPGFQLLCLGDRDELAQELRAESVETRPAALSPVGLEVLEGDPRVTEAFRAGKLYLQDSASQAAALVTGYRAGEQVLDVAAAPGGKTFSLLAAAPSASVTALDRSLPRLLRMRENMERLDAHFPIVIARAEDSCLRSGFDRVIVDLPCSGTGTFARHPELKWRFSEAELGRLARQGLAMLLESADLVGPGGGLSVLTCSVEREENEGVVERFLRERPGFRLEELDPAPELAPFVEAPGRWRVLPGEGHDGFTVHSLRRE